MNVVLAYPAFVHSFTKHFPELNLAWRGNKVDLEIVKKADLVIFSGGEDINPAIYGEENTYSYFNPKRDAIELDVLKEALKENKKILGVCRGHQLINAFLGGTLIQDLYHDLQTIHASMHSLNYIYESPLKEIYLEVNSLHHQGVIVPGKNLKISAEYKGVIESTESEKIISVQYHPEFMPNGSAFFEYIEEWVNE